jgi:hypothetical protein
MTDYAAMISLVHILFAVMLTMYFLQRHRTTSTTPVLPVLPIILYDLLPKGWTTYEGNKPLFLEHARQYMCRD